MRGTAALANEFDLPAGAAEAVIRHRRGRRAADPPAGDGGGRRRQRVFLRLAPAAEQQSRQALALGGELQPPSRGHIGAFRLAQHRGETAMTDAILHHREQFGIVPAFGIKDQVGSQTRLRQSRCEQVTPGHRPKHLPVPGRAREPRCQRRLEQSRGRVAGHVRPGRRDFVQRPQRQATTGKPVIHIGEIERQKILSTRWRNALDTPYLAAQGGQTLGLRCGSGHKRIDSIVRFMFRFLCV